MLWISVVMPTETAGFNRFKINFIREAKDEEFRNMRHAKLGVCCVAIWFVNILVLLCYTDQVVSLAKFSRNALIRRPRPQTMES